MSILLKCHFHYVEKKPVQLNSVKFWTRLKCHFWTYLMEENYKNDERYVAWSVNLKGVSFTGTETWILWTGPCASISNKAAMIMEHAWSFTFLSVPVGTQIWKTHFKQSFSISRSMNLLSGILLMGTPWLQIPQISKLTNKFSLFHKELIKMCFQK